MTSYNAFRDGEPLALALDEVAKLRARIEKLEAALREIAEHCTNEGRGNEIVDARIIDRCEWTARAALEERT